LLLGLFEFVLFVLKDILRDLHLPKENTLFLLTPSLTPTHPATSDGWVIGCASYSRSTRTLNCRRLLLPGSRDTHPRFRDSPGHSGTVGRPTQRGLKNAKWPLLVQNLSN